MSAMQKVKLHPATELVKEIEDSFKKIFSTGTIIDSITFSGNGESTLHPEFGTLVREVKRLRNHYFPAIPVSILSDSSRVYLPEVREALEKLDERYMKLDTGDQEMYQKINNPVVKADWNRIVDGLSRLSQVTLQSLFLSEPVDNSSGEALNRWLAALARIHPVGLQIYTVYRDTADPKVKSVTSKRLSEIAHLACQVTDLSTVTAVTDTFLELM